MLQSQPPINALEWNDGPFNSTSATFQVFATDFATDAFTPPIYHGTFSLHLINIIV